MQIGNETITDDQLAAGLAAMRGQFKARDVRHALSQVGVSNTNRAADRLIQRARKAGRIRAINNKNWEALPATLGQIA